uniref:Uncharacterized protein n=1 Tax=Romanomermis culicivorax TaxID=13658 RepID=A0A915KEB2_ROMCU
MVDMIILSRMPVEDLTDQSTNGNSMHYHMNQLVSATPRITDHTDQLMSATPCIIDTTPQARMRRKTIGPLTTRCHIQLDD